MNHRPVPRHSAPVRLNSAFRATPAGPAPVKPSSLLVLQWPLVKGQPVTRLGARLVLQAYRRQFAAALAKGTTRDKHSSSFAQTGESRALRRARAAMTVILGDCRMAPSAG